MSIFSFFFIFYSSFRDLVDGVRVPFAIGSICHDIEFLIKERGCGPLLLRLSWQSACLYDKASRTGRMVGQVRDAPYKDMPCCKGLDRAVGLLIPIHQKHPQISWPDLVALSGCVAVVQLGGPRVRYRFGRQEDPQHRVLPPMGLGWKESEVGTDAKVEEVQERCPDSSKGVAHVVKLFFRLGLTPREAVALMGAHTVGGMHRVFSGFNGQWTEEQYLFDNKYFIELLRCEWKLASGPGEPVYYRNSDDGQLAMLPSDLAILKDEKFAVHVNEFARNQDAWHIAFANAFQKLQELGWERKLYGTGMYWKE